MADDPRESLIRAMPERGRVGLQEATRRMALAHNWRVYHVFDSRRSAPGFPDAIAIRGGVLLAAELKREGGKVTPDQAGWLEAFAGVRRVEVRLWTPRAWHDDEIGAFFRDAR